MYTYIVESETSDGLLVHIVNATTASDAETLAIQDGAWPGCVATIIDICTPGVRYKA